MGRKIVIEKIGKKEKARTLVELDNDVHSKISEIAFKTDRSIKDCKLILQKPPQISFHLYFFHLVTFVDVD